MEIVIFENDPAFRRYLEAFVRQYTHHPSILQAGNMEEIETYIAKRPKPTLFFLDIVFENDEDKTHGFTIAKKIKEQRPEDLLVFVTAYRNRIEGNTFYQVSAFNTIYKPTNVRDWSKINQQLAATIDLARNYFDRQCLVLSDRENKIYIPKQSICYIEAIKGQRRIAIHTVNGWYMMRSWLKDVKDQLDERFLYASRFIIVNRHAIRRADKTKRLFYFSNHLHCNYSYLYAKRYGLF